MEDCAMKAWPCTTSRPSLRDRRRMKPGGGRRSSIGQGARAAIRRRIESMQTKQPFDVLRQHILSCSTEATASARN